MLTDRPSLVEALEALPDDTIVLSTVALPAPRPNWYHVVNAGSDETAALLNQYKHYRHVRVIADLDASGPRVTALATHVPSLMALCDLTFAAVKVLYDRLADVRSSFISLFLGAWQDGKLHPLAGMFSGVSKSAWLELGDALTYALFTSTREPLEGVAQAHEESAARRLMPVIGYDGGRRVALRVRTEEPAPMAAEPLAPGATVLAVGGARGITTEILKDIARRYRPRVFIIGSNDLDGYPPSAFSGTDEAFARSRAEYLRRRKTEEPTLSIGTLNVEFDRMANARVTHRNLQQLEALCGAGNVTYRACNVLDREQLAAVVRELLPTNGTLDLIIYAAGINRASSIQAKSLETFRSVRDLKVLGYQNLRHALMPFATRRWFNFGSFVGFSGQLGELDYAAGNDFLVTAAAAANGDGPHRETTICWTVWDEVGMVQAHPLTASLTKRSGRYTSMSTAEGLSHFERELRSVAAEASIVLMGPNERKSIMGPIPDYFDEPQAAPLRPFTPQFYLDRVVGEEPDLAVFERTFSLERDSYLSDHRVNGHPTLPGTFVPELAAEAALALFPHLKVVALEDLRFEHFLRVYGEGDSRKRIEARVLECSETRAVVSVRILTDVLGPGGRVLTRDKLHFSARVVLMPEYATAPRWDAWDDTDETPVPDPYHFENSPVVLSGLFVTTRDTRMHPLGKRAVYACRLRADDPAFSRFVTPCLMMDGLARVGVLHLRAHDYLPVAAPATIRRIDLYQGENDCALASAIAPGEIQLYVTPTGMILGSGDRENRCVAAGPDGRMLLQMKGVTGTILGYVHRHTGEFLTPQALERVVQATTDANIEARSEPASGAVAPVTRVRWKPTPIAAAEDNTGRLTGRNVLVVGGTDELAGTVVNRLQSLGAVAARWTAETNVDETLDGVIDLAACEPLAQNEERPWEAPLERSVTLLKALYDGWARELDADRIFYMPVTMLGGLMGYDGVGLTQPYGGVWSGLAKSLPRELPNCNVKVLDIDTVAPDAAADLIAQELGVWDLFEVGYRGTQRYGLLAAKEERAAPTLTLDAEDTVLISGGGRGIGFSVAEALCRRTGCRVIVTGRSSLPDASEPWLQMSDEAFRAYSFERLIAGAASGEIAQSKADIAHLRHHRELIGNLERSQQAGLRIEYRVCDFNERAQVEALVQSLDGLSVVIHNAGIDAPVRLAAKSMASFLGSVRVKLAGFLNLLHAVLQIELKLFCNVGSIAGRMGGMAGQTGYAAANDGLTRLGFWGQQSVRFPIKMICWPVWEKLGLIGNFDAAVKYMTAMQVEEGVAMWVDEILAGGSGEVCFPGRPGVAVSPLELKGFRLVTPDFPSFDALNSRAHYLGALLEHRRARTMRSRARIDASSTPMLDEFRVAGHRAVPISLLLEYAAALAADELTPENWPALRLVELRNCTFELTHLTLEESQSAFEFERDAHARWDGARWVVDVAFVTPGSRRQFGSVQIVFVRADEAPEPSRSVLAQAIEPVAMSATRHVAWSLTVLDAGVWGRTAQGELVGKVRRRFANDVWALPYAPRMRLPGWLIEAALQAAAWSTTRNTEPTHMGFACLRLLSGATPVRLIAGPHASDLVFVDEADRVTHALEAVSLYTHNNQQEAVNA
ncbi:MAG: SDR family NAD(P)-dependent oxidoreductase [Betaproteobacteria bacterium]